MRKRDRRVGLVTLRAVFTDLCVGERTIGPKPGTATWLRKKFWPPGLAQLAKLSQPKHFSPHTKGYTTGISEVAQM